MKLAAYLECNDISPAEFAGRISVHETSVYRYLRGERIPNRDTLERIHLETNGQVTANDFFTSVSSVGVRQDFAAA